MPCLNAEKVVNGLVGTVLKEQRWLPSLPYTLHPSKEYVQPSQRDFSVQQLLKLAVHFRFEPETFCLAVRFIDIFLGKVKVHPKYLEVISLSSLVLASKLSEEDEYIPEIDDFVVVSRSSCTGADVIRMERVILDKLGWNMIIPTPLTFLEQYCSVLESFGCFKQDEKRSIVQHATPTLLQLLTNSFFLQHKSSTIALAVLSYELSFFSEPVTASLSELANYAQVHDSELMHCQSLLQDFFERQLLAACKEKRRKKKRTHSASSSTRTMPTIWESGDEITDHSVIHVVNSKENESCVVNCEKPVREKDQCREFKVASHADIVQTAVDDFPNICETVSKCRRTESESSSSLTGAFFSGKPLYSTIVKGCSSVAYSDNQFLVSANHSSATRAF